MSRACRRWIASWWPWIGISSRCAPRWRSARRWATALPASPWSEPPGAARAPRRARPSGRMRPWTAAAAQPARRAVTDGPTRFLLDEHGPLAVAAARHGGVGRHVPAERRHSRRQRAAAGGARGPPERLARRVAVAAGLAAEPLRRAGPGLVA